MDAGTGCRLYYYIISTRALIIMDSIENNEGQFITIENDEGEFVTIESKENTEALLPPKPECPLESDCCGLGCTPCVFDRYDEEVKLWERECAGLQGRKDQSEGSHTMDTSSVSVLSETEYRGFLITSLVNESGTFDSLILTVKHQPAHTVSIKTGQHVIVRIIEGQTATIRQYTPIEFDETQGYFKLLIKIYPTGRMSGHLSMLKVGDFLQIRGPAGGFSYRPNQWQCVYLIAAGTGIAPMSQIIRQVIANEEDDTRVYLVYSCQKYEDILLKPELNNWAGYWNVTIRYFLTQETQERVQLLKGYADVINCEHIKATHLRDLLVNKPSNYQVFVCGTPSFDRDVINYLKVLEIPTNNLYKF